MNEFDVRAIVGPDVLDLLVSDAEQGEAHTITRDGKPVAVLIGIEEYETIRANLELLRAGPVGPVAIEMGEQ